MNNVINFAANVVNPVLNGSSDVFRVLYEGYENAPQSAVYPPGFAVPAPNGLDGSMYQAVKTNLAFIDALYVGAKWIFKDYWSKFAVGIVVIRTIHIGMGLWNIESFAAGSLEKRTIKADLLLNTVNAVVGFAAWYFNAPKAGLITFFMLFSDTAYRAAYHLLYLDQNQRLEPFDRKFRDYHSQMGMDIIKTISYVAHFALAAVVTYLFYQHGQKLLQVALTLEEGPILGFFSAVCGIGALSYGISQRWGQHELSKIALGFGSCIGLSLFSHYAAIAFGYDSPLKSLSAVQSHLAIGLFGLALGFLVYKSVSKINEIIHYNDPLNPQLRPLNDPFRKLMEGTCTIVGSAVTTAFVSVRYQYAQSVQKFWLLALQIGIIASGSFLLLSATYIGLSRLLLQVPPSDGVEPAWNRLKDTITQLMP